MPIAALHREQVLAHPHWRQKILSARSGRLTMIVVQHSTQASGAGWLQRCQQQAVPGRSADCPDLGGCARDGSEAQIRGWPSARSLRRTESFVPGTTPLMVLTKRSA